MKKLFCFNESNDIEYFKINIFINCYIGFKIILFVKKTPNIDGNLAQINHTCTTGLQSVTTFSQKILLGPLTQINPLFIR